MLKSSSVISWISFLFLLVALAGCVPASGANSKSITVTPVASNVQTPLITFTPAPVLTTSHISGWAVYSLWVSQDPVVSQIFLKNLDTGKTTQLTSSGNNDRPLWSPDGSQIMFLSWTKENSFDIYLMDKDGRNQRPIVSSPASETMADWSPDGKKVAYVSNKDGSYEIYVIDLQTYFISKMINNSGISNKFPKWSPGTPKWSPDDKQITFVSTTGISNTSQVFIMDADGANVRQMTYDRHYDDSPVWCPDTSCIIFARDLPKLMLLNIKSGDVAPLLVGVFLSEKAEYAPVRSPSRGYITFAVDGMFYAMDMKSREIYPLNVQAKYLSLYP
jgi:Tol biopolymer transport system component